MAWVHSHVDITVRSSGKQLVEPMDAEAQILRTSLVFPTIPSLFSCQLSVVFVVFYPKDKFIFEDKNKNKKMLSYLGLIPPNLAQARHLGVFNKLRRVHELGND